MLSCSRALRARASEVSFILLGLAARVPQMLRAERRVAGQVVGSGWDSNPERE